MINLPIWLLVVLIATNIIVWLAVSFFAYLIAYIRDITYYNRHKPNKREQNCPYEVDSDDTKD